MSTTPRTFKSMTKPLDIARLKSAVTEVARADNVPTLSFPNSSPAEATAPTDAAPAPTPETPTTVATLRKPKAARKSNPAPVSRVAIDLPDYLILAINKKAAEEGVTKRFLHIKALKADGFAVHDVDLQEDSRRES
jgi:hypothetical protein